MQDKFERKYQNSDGTTDVWKYDLFKEKHGPVCVEIIYPKKFDFSTKDQELSKSQKELPLTQRKWINPKNGKAVGYQRAKALGLVK